MAAIGHGDEKELLLVFSGYRLIIRDATKLGGLSSAKDEFKHGLMPIFWFY